LYLARRNRLVARYQKAQDAVNNVSTAASPVSTSSPRVYPVVMASGLVALVDGTEIYNIERSPQEFTVQGRVRNISTWSQYDISTRLDVESSSGAVEVLSTNLQVIGKLDFDNGIPGQGPDEALLTWTCRYAGPLSNAAPFGLSVTILEKTNTPVSFLTYSSPLRLQVQPAVVDEDHDGFPDDFERSVGLDPARDDSVLDLDQDGLSNEREYFGETLVHVADSDDDGLNDFEELRPGVDRQITNPLLADSDGDGSLDGVDAEPLVAAEDAEGFRYAEPELVLTPSVVYLTPTKPLAQVEVSSRSGAPINWTALSMEEALISVFPKIPDARPAGELLISSAGYAAAPTSSVMVTRVKVFDLLAGPGAERDVLVIFNSTIDAAVPVSASISGTALTLNWTSAPGQSYVVQYSSDLRSWIDSPTGSFGVTTAGQNLSWRDEGVPSTQSPPGQNPVRFYRVLPIAQP
jgi:hypothetical protein